MKWIKSKISSPQPPHDQTLIVLCNARSCLCNMHIAILREDTESRELDQHNWWEIEQGCMGIITYWLQIDLPEIPKDAHEMD